MYHIKVKYVTEDIKEKEFDAPVDTPKEAKLLGASRILRSLVDSHTFRIAGRNNHYHLFYRGALVAEYWCRKLKGA